VERLMRQLGLAGRVRGRRRTTTIPAPVDDRPSDLVERAFTASAPNQLWVADIERHGALSNRAVVRGHRHGPVAAGALKLRAA
jgi:putative transposase